MIQMGKVCNRKNGNFKLSGSIRSMGTEFLLLLPGPTLTQRSVVYMKLVWSEEAGIGESNDSKQIDKCLINSLAYGSLFGYGTMVVVSFQRVVVLFSYELTRVVHKKRTTTENLSPSLPCQYFIFQSVSLHHVASGLAFSSASLQHCFVPIHPRSRCASHLLFILFFSLVHLMTRHYTLARTSSRVD